MKRTGRKQEWSITFFCIALLCLLPPLITIFNRSDFIGGIPTTYLLLFALWGGMILVTAIGARRRTINPPPPPTRLKGAPNQQDPDAPLDIEEKD